MTTFWGELAGSPDRVILADDHGRTMTGPQLAAAAERVAAGLGIGPGDVVSWQLPTAISSMVVLAAIARAGAVSNPIIPILREREVRSITQQVGTTVFICPETWRGFGHAEMARSLGLSVLALDESLTLPEGDPSSLPAPPSPSSEDECRWLYFSSGTTADPKGVRHSDRSLMASSQAMNDHLGFGEGDLYPIAFPITHIGGMTMLTAAIRRGGVLLLLDTWDPATTPERVAAHKPTILGSAQPFFRAYLDAQKRSATPLYPSLRTCTAGGAPTPPELIHELVEAFGVTGVVNSWGLTEFPIVTCPLPSDPPEVLASTVGRPSPGVTIRVVDGELRCKGPQCFLGYVDPSLDADAFDDEGWFRTGDLGEIDPDGSIRITGRLKDVIIRNAENISALEIEDVLLRHPAVVDVAVIGVPDARTGEHVCAVVVGEVTLQELAAHCIAEGLAKQKCPEQLELVDAIPRNPMGKPLKQDLKARFAS